MREADRRRWEAIRRDQQLIQETARWLRHRAIQDQYSGLQRMEVTFALACIFDTISLTWRQLPEAMQSEVRSTCEAIAAADIALHSNDLDAAPPQRASG